MSMLSSGKGKRSGDLRPGVGLVRTALAPAELSGFNLNSAVAGLKMAHLLKITVACDHFGF
jgi:hypothetical protein